MMRTEELLLGELVTPPSQLLLTPARHRVVGKGVVVELHSRKILQARPAPAHAGTAVVAQRAGRPGYVQKRAPNLQHAANMQHSSCTFCLCFLPIPPSFCAVVVLQERTLVKGASRVTTGDFLRLRF